MLAGYSSMSVVRIYVSCKPRRAKCVERLELDNIIGRRWILMGVSVIVEGCGRVVLREAPTARLARQRGSSHRTRKAALNFQCPKLTSTIPDSPPGDIPGVLVH
jgi:hypothetical protein